MDLISISDRGNAGHAYGSACGGARGRRRTEHDHSRHVAVDGSVSAGVCNMTMERGDGMEECGVGFGITFEVFHVGENAA